MRPPTKNDQKWTQNGCKCIAFGTSSLGLFGLTFRLKIVIGDKTLKHTLHAKHHCVSVDHLSGHLGTCTSSTTLRHGGGLGACALRYDFHKKTNEIHLNVHVKKRFDPGETTWYILYIRTRFKRCLFLNKTCVVQT